MSQENVDLVRASWEAWERGDSEAVFAFYDPDIVWENRVMPDEQVFHGHDGVKRFFRRWMSGFEDYYAHAEEFLDARDAVVVRGRQGGRGKSSGAAVDVPLYWQVYWIRDGRAVRIVVYPDADEAFAAVGLSPG